MPDTFVKIASVTVGSGGASSIDFTSIPSTYTDLCLKLSGRSDNGTDAPLYMTFNNTSSGYSHIYLLGSGSAASSGNNAYGVGTTKFYAGTIDGVSNTSNTFANTEIYVPNYAGSNNKSVSFDSVEEGNSTGQYAALIAGLWANTSAINRLTLTTSTNFVQYSTAVLYGIKSS